MFKPQINAIGVITSQINAMKEFYTSVLGFKVIDDMGEYVEFEHEGVRFALSTHSVMTQATGSESYNQKTQGQILELMFKVDTPEEVTSSYEEVVSKGAQGIKAPSDMPWGQRTAFFADPDGNIHEIFCDL